MNTLEVIVMAFVIIETAQIFFLLRSSRQTKKLIETIITNPELAAALGQNLVFGVMNEIHSDKKKREIFFNFLGHCGAAAIAGVKGKVAPGVKLKNNHPLKPLEDFIPGLLDKFMGNVGPKVVDKASDAALAGWD